jgi:GNAT superfamily N-acetyltransferase
LEGGQTGDLRTRPASAGDIEALCGLYTEFHGFHVRNVPDRLASIGDGSPDEQVTLHARLAELIAASDSVVLVAEKDGTISGLAEVYVREDERVPGKISRRFAHLQSMVVTEKHRGAGVGRLLLGAAEAWARDRGAAEMRLDVWEFADGPLGFYESCGYRTLRRTLVRGLR